MNRAKFKEILIFVAGTTPQIITETIYALIHRNPPVYPDEAYVITSAHGKNLIKKDLLKSGIFTKFCREFRIPETILTEDSVVVIKDSEGKYLDDIRDGRDNECLGDFITEFIRNKAADNSVRLHCSLAGGRKTMGFYLGAALQLFGRSWDKLYHVLVTPEFESNPDFYYKPKKDKKLTPHNPPLSKRGKEKIKPLHTKDAEIVLAELPFIRLREKIPLDGKGFKELVSEGQREIDTAMLQPFIRINLKERSIYIGDTPIDLVPLQMMIYIYFLRQKLEYCKYKDNIYCLECAECFATIAELSTKPVFEKMLKDYGLIYSIQPSRADDLREKSKEGMSPEILRSNISKINRAIKEQAMDETLLPYYSIATVKQYAGSRYGVRVEKGKIRIE